MLVIFDLDGTLIDTKDEIFSVFSKAFENLELILDRERMERYIGLPLRELLEKLLGEYDERVEREIAKVYYSDRERKIRLFPGMEGILNGNFRRAILTSKKRKTAIYDLSYLGLLEHFPIIVGADDIEKKKPCAEGIFKIIHMADCKRRDRVFMVGDTEMDIMAAKNAKVNSVAVTWGFRSEEFLERYEPDYIVHNPDELKRILEGN